MKKAFKGLVLYVTNALCMLGVAIIATAMFQQNRDAMFDGSGLGLFFLCQGAVLTVINQILIDDGD